MSLIVHLMCNPSGERELTAKPQHCNNGDAHGEPLNRALHRLTNQTASCSLFPHANNFAKNICRMKSASGWLHRLVRCDGFKASSIRRNKVLRNWRQEQHNRAAARYESTCGVTDCKPRQRC